MGQNRKAFVQSVAAPTITFSHPLINNNTPFSLKGAKLEGDVIDAVQMMDNSKIVPLLDGSTVTITNNVIAGTITLKCVRTTGSILDGDITTIAQYLTDSTDASGNAVGDSTGGTLVIQTAANGKSVTATFNNCTIKTAPPLRISGNDVPEYSVDFLYSSYTLA